MYVRDASLVSDLSLLALQDYEYIRYTNDRSIKDAFLANELPEPYFEYHDVDPLRVEERLADIETMAEVVGRFDDALVRVSYGDKLRELREKYELIRAARSGDDAAILDASIRLYGDPQQELFQHALEHARACLAVVKGEYGSHPLVKRHIDTLGSIVPASHIRHEHSWGDIRLPEVRTYADDEALSSSGILRLMYAAFERYGIEGWHAIVDAPGERTTFSTDQERTTIFIPSDEDLLARRYPLTRERVESIIAHEVGVHVRRRVMGERSPLRLLGFGLAGYLRAEEGIATYAEQVRDGARHFAGILGYLSVGLARGVDGVGRTFRELYEILHSYMIVASLEHAFAYREKVDVEALCERAKRRAWARCVRTFRGTTGTTPGACFTKDIVYLEGNIAIWQLVTKEPEWVERFHLGKYDPTNEVHVSLLRELGMVR